MERIRVIIADDLEDTRRSLKIMLSFSKDIEVIGEAKDGEETLAMVERLKPDVLVLDINMPKVDGISVLKTITKRFPEVKIVAISFQSDKEYERALKKFGASYYLVKPFTISQLIEAIKRAFEGGKASW